MPFLRVDIDIAAVDADTVEELCLAAGAVAVTLVDRRDDPVLEPLPGEVRLWPATCLQALFAPDDADRLPDGRALLARLVADTGIDASAMRCTTVEDRAWEREWLRDFHPMPFGRRLWVVPGEHAAPAGAGVVLRLDPGLAFGTGTHETTAMCLAWLDAQQLAGREVIDYGCGSGILAIAALLLGAPVAQVFDIDPQALLASDENARRNAVRERLQVRAVAAALEPADIVIANILAGPLAQLAPRLCALLRPGGQLVLAGLLAAQVEELCAAYAPWLPLTTQDQRGDWALLAGQRPPDAAQFRP